MTTTHEKLNDLLTVIESYSQATASLLRERHSITANELDTVRVRINKMADALNEYERLNAVLTEGLEP